MVANICRHAAAVVWENDEDEVQKLQVMRKQSVLRERRNCFGDKRVEVGLRQRGQEGGRRQAHNCWHWQHLPPAL